jgi:aspartate/methionine/tyrosine aminotransferase
MPPTGATEALNELGQGSNGVIIFHSLSKRSSAAGLRAGFIAGDKVVIEKYRQLVANGGVSISEPQLRVAEALYKDEKHVVKNRQFYDKNFQLSEQILKSTKPQGGFFNFIPVENDLLATKHLWKNHGVKVMPGSFMAFENNNDNPGKNYLRIALVNDADTTKKGLDRVSNGLKELV